MMGVETKMESSASDEESNFIRRPAILIHNTGDVSDDEPRPMTPPMEQSLKLNKSLGIVMSPSSPPYRKIRSMKIIESPRPFLKSRLDHILTSTPNNMSPCAQNSFSRNGRMSSLRMQRSRLSHLNHSDAKDKVISPAAYVNPFSPNYLAASKAMEAKCKSMKRSLSKRINFDCEEMNDDVPLEEEETHHEMKKPKLSDFNIPRYQEEFLELEVIGVGEHGKVFKCLNLLNGMEYAVKRGLKPVNNERIAHNEIYAHGVLEHPNIVRNYSSWTENDYVFMQNEYCNGGSLEEAIVKNGPLEERQLKKVLEHIAQGLRFIHSKHLAHMDIKPGNILISRGPKMFFNKPMFLESDEFGDDDDPNEETIYKIADLGHVTKLDDVVDVEEGDCRYLPKELLNHCTDLTKVDIFALGLTLYEAAGGGPLPKNGEEWHAIRDGKLKPLHNLSTDFNNLIKKMVHPDPSWRPTATEIVMETASSPVYKTVKDKHKLKAAQQEIQVLKRQLQEFYTCVKVMKQNQDTNRPITVNNNKGERLIGKKSKRSQSASNL